MFVRCPFCHKRVLRWFYASHERRHTQRRSDGQMVEHVTETPAHRYAGSLEGIPRAYSHTSCGVVTQMPEEIIRSYLVTPLLYTDSSFCCGCGDYVSSAELVWQETGEKVMDYMGRLRADYLRRTYGMVVPEPTTPIIVTPGAAEAIHGLARGQGMAPPYFFVLGLAGGNYTADLAPNWDPEEEIVTESAGVQVVSRKEQLDQLRGTVVEYQKGAREGFQICRLYAPG